MAACQITINFTAINEIDISPELSAAHPYFDVYVCLFLNPLTFDKLLPVYISARA